MITTDQITSIIASSLAMRFANLTLNQPNTSPNCRYKELWEADLSAYQPDVDEFSQALDHNDPLIQALQGNREIVTVAAAGNADFNFPFAPANFADIISAGAGKLKNNYSCAGFTSNSAHWLVTSDDFTYPNTDSKVKIIQLCLNPSDPNCRPELVPLGEEVHLQGTSFAAPRLSFYIARHLLLFGDKTGCVERLRQKESNNGSNLDPFIQDQCKDRVP